MVKSAGQLPPISDILDDRAVAHTESNAQKQILIIEKILAELGTEASVVDVYEGPTVTQFRLAPGPEVKLSQLKSLDQDLALALSGVPVQIAEPSPDHPYARIIVAKQRRTTVRLRAILESAEFERADGLLKIGLGLDTFGTPLVVDLTTLPHLLIGGTTGSGKSVCINAIISGLLCLYLPEQVQFLMIDPLRVELKKYDGLPHLFCPVITESAQVIEALDAANQEINRRFTELSKLGVRNLAAYNRRAPHANKNTLPYLIVVIDNLVDLMMRAPKEIEQALVRLAAMGRSAGTHLVFATQRSNVDIVAGAIKANASGRIAFRVTSSADSQLILDMAGAEELSGEGDMLFKSPEFPTPRRAQGVYVAEAELDRISGFWRRR